MGSFLFGEIVEPSTRAFIDEDLDEYPQYTSSFIEWEGNFVVPTEIKTLIFTETENIRQILNSCILEDQKPICGIYNDNVDVKVHNLENNVYLVFMQERGKLTFGQVVEAFEQWIKTAESVYAITSDQIANYQNINLYNKPPSIIRMISNDCQQKFVTKLESPNLVTGLGASVLTYCIHNGLKCSLFVIYVDNVPLDSLNMGPLLKLFEGINVTAKRKVVNVRVNSSNLYL